MYKNLYVVLLCKKVFNFVKEIIELGMIGWLRGSEVRKRKVSNPYAWGRIILSHTPFSTI